MRRRLTAAALAPDPLQAIVDDRLDARLDRASAASVALGLSGGGDSLALLHIAADWCARAGRPLLALTVDHRLAPESAGWTARAGRMAAEAGAAWRSLAWTGAKPAAGLPAAGRVARHALLADAAREAGAAVLLLAHTADDLAETEALRAGPVPAIGHLREWAPSPAWPEGRGVFLLRPLLTTPREALRARLVAGGRDWIEDPANDDPRFARARVRRRRLLAEQGLWPPIRSADPRPGRGLATPDGIVSTPRRPLDSVTVVRDLRAALACAAGGARPVRRGVLARLLDHLDGDDHFTTVVGGACVAADAAHAVIGREAGRAGPPDQLLAPDVAVVWDGRFEFRAQEPGWSVGLARGRMARLPGPEREELAATPASLRPGRPVLLRGGEVRLRAEGVAFTGLVPARFDAAVGRIRREVDVAPATSGSPRTSPCA